MNEGADDIHSQVCSDAAPRDRLLTAWCESRGQVPSIAYWNRLLNAGPVHHEKANIGGR